jgi:hypothetical protein
MKMGHSVSVLPLEQWISLNEEGIVYGKQIEEERLETGIVEVPEVLGVSLVKLNIGQFADPFFCDLIRVKEADVFSEAAGNGPLTEDQKEAVVVHVLLFCDAGAGF